MTWSLICLALFSVAVNAWAADSSKASRLIDADDGWLDLSQFPDTAYGFGRTEALDRDHRKTVTAGGAGFRYLLARTYGLHIGLDVAVGPDKPIFYVVFGHAWLRP